MKLDFSKDPNGLIPVIIQNKSTLQVLMLGYMNEEAFLKTQQDRKVTFYSRSKKRLWTKGEKSGNYLFVEDIQIDCDNDTILIKAIPVGPTCHKGTTSCFNDETSEGFLYELETVINERIDHNDPYSYTNELYQKGVNKVAQKLGEEAVELVIEAMDDKEHLFKEEAADLIYHYLILLKTKGVKLRDVESVLKMRNMKG